MRFEKPRIAAQWRIAALFFIHALASGAIHTRIPDLQLQLGLNESELGFTLMGLPVGALSMFLFSSKIIERLGPRRTILFLMPVMVTTPALIPLVPNPFAMFALMALNGVAFSVTNIAMNVEADRIEASSPDRIMNTCHGVWSVGFLLTALIGAVARGLHISPLVHLASLIPVVMLAMAVVVWPMKAAAERPHAGSGRRRLAWPTAATLGLVGFGLCAGVLEGGARAWSIIYMRETFEVSAFVQSLTLPALLASMAIGRLTADRFIDRFGPVRVARVLCLVSLLGLSFVALAPVVGAALTGFALIGFGICVTIPLMLSAAARLGDRPSSENVAATTLLIQSTNLLSPAVLGWIAEGFGLRTTFGVMVPIVVLSFIMANRLAPRSQDGAARAAASS
ncbi:MFS transporter [Devosia pacifica]|nr:MFS transporter [Devosia pacifica]